MQFFFFFLCPAVFMFPELRDAVLLNIYKLNSPTARRYQLVNYSAQLYSIDIISISS